MVNHVATSGVILMEHERRFFPNPEMLPVDYSKSPRRLIEQGYLEDELFTRLRNERETSGLRRYFQTKKTAKGVSRHESEIELTKDNYANLWLRRTCELLKTRYFFTLEDGFVAEINIYHDSLEGYIQIKASFASREEALAFVPPDWFGLEVTGDPKHDNYFLARQGKLIFSKNR